MKKYSRSLSKIKYIYVATALFLVALSIYTYIQFNNQVLASGEVSHTYLVKQSLQNISEDVYSAQSNRRGFALLGDSAMLRTRDTALAKLSTELQVLSNLIKDNPDQIRNLQALSQVINDKIIGAHNRRVDVASSDPTENQGAGFAEGFATTNSVTMQISRMAQVETAMLSLRVQRYSDISLITPLYIIVLFLGALFILFYSYYGIHTDLQQMQNLKIELEDSIAHLKEQQKDKEDRAAELVVANKELAYQNEEKEKRAAELVVANHELLYQNEEKEKRAAELVVANHELLYQNEEKGKRAAELIIANKELAYQNEEKEKRATELVRINNELLAFAYVSSHDLQEPLRNIQMFSSLIIDKEFDTLSENAKGYFTRIEGAAIRMRALIEDLISYSRLGNDDHVFVDTELGSIVNDVLTSLKDRVEAKHAIIDVSDQCRANVIPFQFRQLLHNLIGNSLKFSLPERPPHIQIASSVVEGSTVHNDKLSPDQRYCHISVKDNGIGFDQQYSLKIFEVFQRLHGKELYDGTGIGLAIVQKIVDNHHGIIIATSSLDKGATFDIYLPTT